MSSRAATGARPGARFAQFKLVLLGESAVGKSSLVLRFVKDQFDDYRESTIGAAFLTQTIGLDDSTTVKFEIWDTAGQERYKSLAPMYYRNANCAVVVYDITQASSLDKAKAWVKELQRQANENIIIALAGNKLDLVTEHPDKRAITTADAEAYAREAGLLFFETSAKTSENVRDLFTAIARKLPFEQAGARNLRANPRPGVDLRPEAPGTQGADLQDPGVPCDSLYAGMGCTIGGSMRSGMLELLAVSEALDAVKALNTLQSNASIVNAIRQSGRGMNKQAIPEMIEWCRRIGYQPLDFNRLNTIHVAGTKGKGSTSAFISSILAQYLPSTRSQGTGCSDKLQRIGLYTSPHLRFVRERIQIDNCPLSEDAFAAYFFQTWDRLEASAAAAGDLSVPCAKPVYFRFLTLMAFHLYMSENVNTVVVECGIGGEYDSTNILVRPIVTGITSLGIDHTAVLGSTIAEIAWHKAGILKHGAVCYTVPQAQAAMQVLRERAEEKGVELRVVNRRHPLIETGKVKLGLAADFQKTNASLAVEIAAEHLKMLGYGDIDVKGKLPKEFVRGLEEVKWGGRCETRSDGPVGWHLDGGHTLESIDVAGEWFAASVLASRSAPRSDGCPPVPTETLSTPSLGSDPPRILLFNQQARAGLPLLQALYQLLCERLQTTQPFTHAVFCSNITFAESGYRPDLVAINTSEKDVEELKVQKELAQGWANLDHRQSEIFVVRTIEHAVTKARELAGAWSDGHRGQRGEERKGDVTVLVTGSVHLVGGVLEVLETGNEKDSGKHSDVRSAKA